MRILTVVPYFYPRRGGLEQYAFNIARIMVNRGHEIRVLCNDIESKEEIIERIEVVRSKADFIFSNTPIRLNLACLISQNITDWKPDLVNAHTPVIYSADVSAVISRYRKVPFVLTYHNENVHEQFILNLIARTYSYTLNLVTLGLSYKIIVASPFSYHESPFIKLFSKKAVWIPPGVNVQSYTPNKSIYLHQKYRLPHDSKIALFVGQLSHAHRHKGIDVLLLAFKLVLKEVPDSYLVLIGSGDRVGFYECMSEKTGVAKSAIFAGSVAEHELIESYQSADVVVLPSTSVQEGFGMVLLEGAACGKPVIGSSIGGIKYFIRDGVDGFAVPLKNERALADAIIKIFRDDNKGSMMGEAGREKSKDYDWEILVDKTETVFRSAVEDKKSIF